jgi:hypothetical protein
MLGAAALAAVGGASPIAARTPSMRDALPVVLSAVGIAGLVLATTAVRRSLQRGRA